MLTVVSCHKKNPSSAKGCEVAHSNEHSTSKSIYIDILQKILLSFRNQYDNL
jgi:hypothetical protein